ncbi:hypothetical protein LIER_17707 [Lithospermum erythrorhizon]|uniref:Uncharacterized protein n=1 Tax=Lithospermum erythrorhizon TaxID=34254 RepID=A0AAV3QCM9_LITER
MLKEESHIIPTPKKWARICDTCQSVPSTVYCRADCAFLCTGCDARIHASNQAASCHERVCVCEACENAPAAFLCKADAASLCANCDSDIHSANPLARRHHRVPILPIPGNLFGVSQEENEGFLNQEEDHNDEVDEEATSWLLLNPVIKNNKQITLNNLFGGESVDEYLDLDDYNSDQQNQFLGVEQYQNDDHHQHQQQFCVPDPKNNQNDSVKPAQGEEIKNHQFIHHQHQQEQPNYHTFQLGLDYEAPNTEHGYPASYSHSVSVTSLDVGVVPESSMSEGSISNPRQAKGTIDLFSNTPNQIPTQLNKMDREARVLRYREKKKNRKFEKTIRYASRKAYAETRPRVKGRFAKRTDVDVEVNQMFSTKMVTGTGYGVVPSF